MMAVAAGVYTDPSLEKNQVRLAYVLCKKDIQRAYKILEAAIKEYNNESKQ
jgi:aspartate aminotransferase